MEHRKSEDTSKTSKADGFCKLEGSKNKPVACPKVAVFGVRTQGIKACLGLGEAIHRLLSSLVLRFSIFLFCGLNDGLFVE